MESNKEYAAAAQSVVTFTNTTDSSESKMTLAADSKHHSIGSARATSTLESLKDGARGKRRRRKRKTTATIPEEEALPTTSDSKDAFDEYEEDTSRFKPEPPKPSKPPRISSILQEWIATQKEGSLDKKMTSKARKALEKERAASAAAEAEKIRIQLIKDMHEEIRAEKYRAEQEALLEEKQAAMRELQLQRTLSVVNGNKDAFRHYIAEVEDEENWLRYLTCDGLPDPGTLSDMNTFMFVWTMEDEYANMNTMTKKCETVIYLLSKLDEIIWFSLTRHSDYITECKTIRDQFRAKLQEWIDAACYRLLRQIERDMIREDMRTARYVKASTQLVCCIWALVRLPIGLKEVAERDRKPIEVHFKEIDLTIRMPLDVDCYSMAIRGLWLKYDHYSDGGTTYVLPEIPEEYRMDTDLLTFCLEEHATKLKIREEQAEGRRLRVEEKKAALERIENPPEVATARPDRRGKQGKRGAGQYGKAKKPEVEAEPEPLPYLPTPDEIILSREDEARGKIRRHLFTRCEKTEINLRKYRILGGIYHVDLVYQPPQPKDMRREILLTTLQIPKELKHVPFSRPYKAPPPGPDSERTPEVIEAEMKALEAAMEALALVTLKLPDSVLWFEPPLVAHWIPERRIWSTQDVHDIKYNEEKQTIAFRTGRLGVHGLAAYKFVNLPFQSWEMKPEMGRSGRGGVVLSVAAATVQAEFVVREDTVCLNSLVGGPSAALQEIVGEYTKLHFLIERMRAGGCDVFPEADAYSYVKGFPMKHAAAQRHLHECMGLLCTAYAFSWSRWNATRGPREIVLQFKELHGCVAKGRTNATLLVTPSRTVTLQCTEVSPEFTSSPLDGEDAKFYADLYHLALHNAGIKSRLLMQDVSFKLALTVARLLESTNVISVSS